MRWTMDIITHARDRNVRGGLPLRLLFAAGPPALESINCSTVTATTTTTKSELARSESLVVNLHVDECRKLGKQFVGVQVEELDEVWSSEFDALHLYYDDGDICDDACLTKTPCRIFSTQWDECSTASEPTTSNRRCSEIEVGVENERNIADDLDLSEIEIKQEDIGEEMTVGDIIVLAIERIKLNRSSTLLDGVEGPSEIKDLLDVCLVLRHDGVDQVLNDDCCILDVQRERNGQLVLMRRCI